MEKKIETMRHSLAHIMAAAVGKLYKDVKFGIGPPVEDGFYYDFDLSKTTISEDDFQAIEKEMRKIISAKLDFVRHEMPYDKAVKWAKDNNQPYKLELIEELKSNGEPISFYASGDFIDLCRGPHVANTGNVGAFKLLRVAGAYWRGNEKNPQLQRIYGVAFASDEELQDFLQRQEEAKKRDHRKLGQELELFMFHETAPGMPYWLPNGVTIYNELIKFWREEHAARGYKEIVSPLLNKKELYVTSGHFDHYWEDMFSTKENEDGEVYGVKAMNCPNAMVVFGSKPRSYRDLPFRLSDTDTLHRNELSGTLNGLLRVREFRQDDAHIYVTEDQIKAEIARIFEIVERFYSIFGMSYAFRLGTRPSKFMGDAKLWDKAENSLKEILQNAGRDYFVLDGDGAFYGPKIDILMKDVLGREWQMGTIQLDFQQPLRFELKYTDSDGSEKTPICIHRVVYGSLERFIGILIEHTAGKFPVWLAPEQLRLVLVKDDDEKLVKFAREIVDKAKSVGIRVELDDSNVSVGKKIRNFENMKVPYCVVLGEKELAGGKLPLRSRADLGEPKDLTVEELIQKIADETKNRT